MKRTGILALIAFLLLTMSSAVTSVQPVTAQSGPSQEPRVVGALGIARVQGQEVFVHVLAVVQPGENGRAVAEAALAEQGARPVQSTPFALTGLKWPQFQDLDTANNVVTQNYNPANQPTAAVAALEGAQQTWTGVPTARRFAFLKGQTNTTRCPSLVRECQGPQVWDGQNDVGWLRLGGSTLGVTWYGNGGPAGAEADMVLNTRYQWSTGCGNVARKYDIQTVFLHENGHVAGLDHSADPSAVMYATYQGARCALSSDDIQGLQALYAALP